ALSISPRPSTVFAFGVPLFPIVWEQLVEHRTWLLFGFLVGGVSSISLLWPHRAALWTSLPVVGGRSICAVAGGTSWIFCFLATTNFPYRVVLLLLVLPWWLALGETSPPARDAGLGRRLCALFLTALWLAAPKFWFAELSLGLSVLAAGSASWLMIIVGVEQMIWLVLTVAIGVGLTGWAWRRWRMGPA
ncbi:MAG: hypothetical protein Q8J74_00520, partial [Candidatus Didemnitutus sp.]|nr:hypothetical protein [Candidatus Didemnitutus sp.]